MAVPLPVTIIFFFCLSSSYSFRPSSAAAAASVCPRHELPFLDGIEETSSRCPVWVERTSPIEVTGEILDTELNCGRRNIIYSILFYASWCPFSQETLPNFDALSSMFPQIRHLAVEESSALPSIFSRYGVHSLPSILIANGTTMVRYHGPKDLSSLIFFYKKVTGLKPITHFSIDRPVIMESGRPLGLRNGSLREILTREPYLVFAILFICQRSFMYFFPEVFSQFKAFWTSYICHFNLGSQLLEHALHLIDIKRLCSKLNLCNKTRNFQKGANNARVWASSLTSVSLGESSSSRSASSDS